MKPKIPMRPIYKADDGVIRFRANAIVEDLVDAGIIDLNDLARRIRRNGEFSIEDIEEFWQMLGYSISAYGDLSFVRKETVNEADTKAAEIR